MQLVIDPAEQAVDTSPPAQVTNVEIRIRRGVGPKTSGCGEQSSTSCDDLGTLTLTVTAPADDRTAPEQMGYRVRAVAGTPPSGFSLPTQPVIPFDGTLRFVWLDGATDEQEPLDFTFELSAVDRAGNEGPASDPFHVDDHGTDGCRLTGNGDAQSFLLVLSALLGMRWLKRRPKDCDEPRC